MSTDLPCPASTIDKDGQRIYCEQGPKGHWGTHCGRRSESDYQRLLEQATTKKERTTA